MPMSVSIFAFNGYLFVQQENQQTKKKKKSLPFNYVIGD